MEGLQNMELVSPRRAAQKLGFSVPHVIAMCKRGDIPAAKIGNRWRIVWPLALKTILENGEGGSAGVEFNS